MQKKILTVGGVIVLAIVAYGMLIYMKQDKEQVRIITLGKPFGIAEGESVVVDGFRITFVSSGVAPAGVPAVQPGLRANFKVEKDADVRDIGLYPEGANQQDAYSLRVTLLELQEGVAETRYVPEWKTEAIIQHYDARMLVTKGSDAVIFVEDSMPGEGVPSSKILYESGKFEYGNYGNTADLAASPEKLSEAKELIRAIATKGCASDEKVENVETNKTFIFSIDGKARTTKTPQSCPELEALMRLLDSLMQ